MYDLTPEAPKPLVTTNQWVKIREKASGLNAFVEFDIDPDFTNALQEAWFYTEVYVPSELLTALGNNNESQLILNSEGFRLFIRTDGSGNPFWRRRNNAGTQVGTDLAFPASPGNRWYRVEWHIKISTAACDIRVDGELQTGTDPAPPTGLNYMLAGYPSPTPPTNNAFIGIDNMAYSTSGWVSQQYALGMSESFEGGKNALIYLNDRFPEYAWLIMFGPNGDTTTIESGSPGPGPGIPSDAYTVPLTLTPSGTEEYSSPSEYTDAATVLVDLVPTSADVIVGIDAATVALDLQVLGGECHSTWSGSNVGEGDAFTRWLAQANARWSGEPYQRWTAVVSVGETIHC